MNLRDRKQELRTLLLKHLDAVYCADKTVCTTNLQDIILDVIEEGVDDKTIVNYTSISLDVTFFLNKDNDIVRTTIK